VHLPDFVLVGSARGSVMSALAVFVLRQREIVERKIGEARLDDALANIRFGNGRKASAAGAFEVGNPDGSTELQYCLVTLLRNEGEVAAVRRQPRLLRGDLRAPGDQELAQVLPGVHANQARTPSGHEGVPAGTPYEQALPPRRRCAFPGFQPTSTSPRDRRNASHE